MGKFLFIPIALFFQITAQASVHSESAETRSEALALEKKIASLEKSYRIYKKKYDVLKKKSDTWDDRVANMPSLFQARLTPTSGTPVAVSPTTGNATLYLTPYKGNYISLFYRGAWRAWKFSEVSLTFSGMTTGLPYDIFVARTNLGAIVLSSVAWTNRFTRATALTRQDGILVSSSSATLRYVGTIVAASATTFSDNETELGLWNYYNRVPKNMRVFDASNTWNYGTNTFRQAGADAANDINFVIGWPEVLVSIKVKTNNVSSNNTVKDFTVGIGLNTLTINFADLFGSAGNAANQTVVQTWAEYLDYPAAGYHQAAWIEKGISSNNVTTWGDNGRATTTRSGIMGTIEG